jgi:4-aminobutyrate aminotransferase
MTAHTTTHRTPDVRTPLPGPRAGELVRRDAGAMSPSFTRPYPLAVDRGEGSWIVDVDGNVFLDFTAGIAVAATGHSHPDVVAAITAQAGRFLHMSGTDFYYWQEIELAERLGAACLPGHDARTFFTNSGAEAIEGAMKLARYATQRPNYIAFLGAFHGRTLGALSLTASKATQRDRFAPLLPSVYHAPFPAPARGISTADAIGRIEDLLRTVAPPNSVAAVFVEPIQGEGGYLVPPDDFLPRLRELTRRHGILLVVDEVQSGMGRTGRFLAHQHAGVEPDIVCLAKGLASGMPLGAFVAGADLMNWAPGSHGSTFGGNPVACVAALATLDLLEGGLTEHAGGLGAHMLERLGGIARAHPGAVTDVRGRGLMLAVELAGAEMATAVTERAFRRGLLLLTCGARAVRICPPLVLTRDEADVGLDILAEVIASLG